MTEVLKTKRLTLRHFTLGDDSFIVRLLNDPGFLQYIGDNGVRTSEDARNYLSYGPIASYRQHGFGLWAVTRNDDSELVGMCGLIKRDSLQDVDIGFAFLAEFQRQGYAFETAKAVLHYAQSEINLRRVVAITNPDNRASGALLNKLSLRDEGLIQLTGDNANCRLFSTEF